MDYINIQWSNVKEILSRDCISKISKTEINSIVNYASYILDIKKQYGDNMPKDVESNLDVDAYFIIDRINYICKKWKNTI